MNGNKAKVYDKELSLVKALAVDGSELEGYYLGTSGHSIHTGYIIADVNPYTICRNSGIKDKNGAYVFEYDLLKLTHGMKNSCYGFLVWDEFYKSWKIRRRTDRTAYNNIDEWTIETVGNIVLNDSDAEIIYQQEKAEDSNESFIDNSYCPSKFRR